MIGLPARGRPSPTSVLRRAMARRIAARERGADSESSHCTAAAASSAIAVMAPPPGSERPAAGAWPADRVLVALACFPRSRVASRRCRCADGPQRCRGPGEAWCRGRRASSPGASRSRAPARGPLRPSELHHVHPSALGPIADVAPGTARSGASARSPARPGRRSIASSIATAPDAVTASTTITAACHDLG